MAYKKDYEKKRFNESQKELESYSEKAMDQIKAHVHSPQDVLELSNFMAQF